MNDIGHKNNFDHLRLFLALGVFFFHVAELTQLPNFIFLKEIVSASVAVHSFFIISGFLIFMSYERSSSIKSYFSKRIRRIMPGYITIVILSFILLSFLSTLPMVDYFYSSESWKFLISNLSTLNFLHLSLPGVFSEQNYSAVNGALWTIKIELTFYITVPIIAYSYRWFKPTQVLIFIFIFSTFYYYGMAYLLQQYSNNIFTVLQHQIPGQMMFFSTGALLYYNLSHFRKYSKFYLVIALLIYALQSIIPIYPFYALSLTIIVIYLALFLPHLGHITRHGDLSYGIYIWHFPLIQTFISLDLFNHYPLTALMFLLLIVIFLSWLSWHLVEKPFLAKKSHYIQEEDKDNI